MFTENPYTKLYHPTPDQQQVNNWTAEIKKNGLADTKTYFIKAIRNWACADSTKREAYYFANNPDVAAAYAPSHLPDWRTYDAS